MSTFSFLTLRKAAGLAATALLSSASLCALAQVPAVVSVYGATVPHNEQYGAPWQTAVSNRGDFLLYDFKTDALYEYPANGGPEITIAASGVIAGGFTNSGIAVDPRNNNLYLDNNYNGGLIEFPFDAATGRWDLPRQTVASGLNGNLGGTCGNYFQGAGLAINSNGVMAVATENGCGVEIFTVPIDASGNFGAATPIVSNMKARAKTVAIDNAGNISFNEDAGGQVGILFIPAGTTGLANDSTVKAIFNNQDTTKPPVNNVQGVTVDQNGNLYIADANVGEYYVPLESGAPNPAHQVLISPIGASGGPSFDPLRQVLFVPVPNGGTIKDLEEFYLSRVEFGSAAPGVAATPQGPTYYFNAPTTPYTIAIHENGSTANFVINDLSKCGITFTMDAQGHPVEQATAYPAGSTCSLAVTFTPQTVGDVSATLVMQDQSGNILNTTYLHGVGQGSRVSTFPATETAIGTGLKTPLQIASDRSGNLYVADSGLAQVVEFAAGATATSTGAVVASGLTAPTGVAVDDTLDVFIADSGKLLEVPYNLVGAKMPPAPSTVATGFGTNVKLAADGIGDVFVSDPDHARVLRLRNTLYGLVQTEMDGFTQPSAIAAAGNGDLYVADGQNLVAYTSSHAGTVVVNTLSGVTGLAVDPSGSVYVTEAAGTFRIPNENGTLNAADQVMVATAAKAPASVALDPSGNAYIADSAAKDIDFVGTNGSLNLGTLPSTTSTSTANATVTNTGNLPLNVTGFTSTADYSATSTTCTTAAVSVGTTCSATITFNPGPGDDGSLPGQIAVQSDATTSSALINLIGVGAQLATSKTSAVLNGTPVSAVVSLTATVVSTSGTGVAPTGTATLTISGKDAGGVTIAPIVVTQPLTNGVTTYNLTQVEAGSYTFTVLYNGDRVYERSNTAPAVTVAPAAAIMTQPPTSTLPTYVLSSSNTALEPTDGSAVPLYYVYQAKISSTSGNALVGVPGYNDKGALVSVNYGTVAFQQGTGTAPCTASVGADGTVLFQTDCLSVDTSNNQLPNLFSTFTLTPIFTSPDYKSVTGTPFTLTALRHPVVVISSSSPSLNITDGSPASTTLTMTSLLGFGVVGAIGSNNGNNYTLPVGMSCDGLPAHATCSFSYPTPDPSDPNSVDVTPTAPGTVIMTVNTNVAVGTTTSSLNPQSKTFLAMLFGVGFLGLAFRKKKSFRSRLTTSLSLLLFSGVIVSMSACGGGTNTAQPVLNTPAGTYTVTVSAKQVGSKVIAGTQAGTTVTVYGSGNLMSLPFTVSVVVK